MSLQATKIMIKPVSVNEAYSGRRFATEKLNDYKQTLLALLPAYRPPEGRLRIDYEFGLSSRASDADNFVKALQDTLADVYGFNDKLVYFITARKVDVKKGDEYVKFLIQSYEV